MSSCLTVYKMEEMWSVGSSSVDTSDPPFTEVTNSSLQNSLKTDFKCGPLKSIHVRNLTCPIDGQEKWPQIQSGLFSHHVQQVKFAGRVSFYHLNQILERCRNVETLEFKGVTVEIGDDRDLSIENSILGSARPINMDHLRKLTFNIAITNQMDVGTRPGFRFIFAFLNNIFCRKLECIEIKCGSDQFQDLPFHEAFLPREDLERIRHGLCNQNPLMEFIHKKRYTIKEVKVTSPPHGSEMLPRKLDFVLKHGRCTGADMVQFESLSFTPIYELRSSWRTLVMQQRYLVTLRVSFKTLEIWLAIRNAIQQSASTLRTIALSFNHNNNESMTLEDEIPWWNCQCLSQCRFLNDLTLQFESIPVYNVDKLPDSIKKLRINADLNSDAQDDIVKNITNLEEFVWVLPLHPVSPIESIASKPKETDQDHEETDNEGPTIDIATSSLVTELLKRPNIKHLQFCTKRTVKGTARLRRFCEETSTITSPIMFHLKSDRHPFEIVIKHPNFMSEMETNKMIEQSTEDSEGIPHCMVLRSIFDCTSNKSSETNHEDSNNNHSERLP